MRPSEHPSPQIHCPVCEKRFPTDQPGIELPFCSKRCKLIDRARWLGEEYGLPFESEEQESVELYEEKEQ